MRTLVEPLRHRIARRTRIALRGLEARGDQRFVPEIIATASGGMDVDWTVRRRATTAGGMSVVIVGAKSRDLVVKIGHTPETRLAVRREARVLRAIRLRAGLDAFARLVPDPVATGSIAGRAWSVQSALSGTPAARASAATRAEVLADATRVIGELHLATACELVADHGLIDRWVRRRARLVHVLLGLAGQARWQAEVDQIARELETILRDRTITTSWVHGDYWANNVLVGSDRRVAGIVDWDSARARELATHDALHLAISAQRARTGRSWGAALRGVLDPGDGSPTDLPGIEPIDGLSRRDMLLLYWLFTIEVNHVRHASTVRSRTWIDANVVTVLEGLR